MHGDGILTSASGETRRGHWVKGKQVSSENDCCVMS